MRVHLSDGSDETRYGAQQIEILTNANFWGTRWIGLKIFVMSTFEVSFHRSDNTRPLRGERLAMRKLIDRQMSASGYKQTFGEVRQRVRFTPDSGHRRPKSG
jgi:hypothetical protein